MIIIGDLEENFKREISKIDESYNGLVIQVGDAQIIYQDNNIEKELLNWLEKKNYTFVTVGGNHDNYKRIWQYPLVDFCGSKAFQIRKNIYYLLRGAVYEFEGKKCFCIGGAISHNIEQGYVDIEKGNVKEQFLDLMAKGRSKFRIKDINWFAEEEPSKIEMNNGLKALAEKQMEVDYIFTHTAPSEILKRVCNLGGEANEKRSADRPDITEFTEYLQMIYQKVKFKKWFCGHLHRSYTNGKITVLGSGEIDYE